MGGESFFAHLSMKEFEVYKKYLTFCCSVVNLDIFYRIKGKETTL